MRKPLTRPLRIFAFDPSLGRRYGNLMTVKSPRGAAAGPAGQLDRGDRLRRQPAATTRRWTSTTARSCSRAGSPPREADPRFHQQMVYAVASRPWSTSPPRWGGGPLDRRGRAARRGRPRPLRIFPHAMQEANAYYDPRRTPCSSATSRPPHRRGANLPGQTVFTCLSHDIIAHETTHALIHDIRERFMEPTSPDTLAFHEAFADIVALFQHFTFKEALLDHILRTGGVLSDPAATPTVARRGRRPRRRPTTVAEERSATCSWASPSSSGRRWACGAALRERAGHAPDPEELDRRFEPHERGAMLVAAVFDAFFTVYSHRMADLLRIARVPAAWAASASSAWTSPDRLAGGGRQDGRAFLNMCIRALDYCPPVDITFGDFLRAADHRRLRPRARRRPRLPGQPDRGIPAAGDPSRATSLVFRVVAPLAARGGTRREALVCEGLDFDVIWGHGREGPTRNAQIRAGSRGATPTAWASSGACPSRPGPSTPCTGWGPTASSRSRSWWSCCSASRRPSIPGARARPRSSTRGAPP